MTKRMVKAWARLLLGVLLFSVVVGGIFWAANNAPEDKVNGTIVPITTSHAPRAAEMVTLVIIYLPTPAPNPGPVPIETPTKL